MSSKEEVDIKHLLLKHPFNALISGPSQSGKTTVIKKILEHHKKTIYGLNKDIIKVCWAYGKSFDKTPLKNVDVLYVKGLPDEEQIKDSDIIIFDDLMMQIEKDKNILELFIAGTHHDNKSVFVIIQNFFHKSDIFKEMRDNAHYLIIFNNPGDNLTPQLIGRRMYPYNSKYFISSFLSATEKPHGYLLVDRHQETPNQFRLRTDIIPKEENNFEIQQTGFIDKNV